jgi:eukaryotic-like serine/threonine-protein kinase
MKRRPQALDPNLDSAFVPREARSVRPAPSGPPAPGRFDGEIPTYVFMRTLDAEERSEPSTRLQKPERKARERGRLEPDLPEIGSILDKYRIEELLGRGGFAVVYRATHLLLRTAVAVKLLRPRVIQKDPSFARLLCEEARYAARINHPNVVRVQDVTHTPEITYVVMEYIDGSTLARVIEKNGPLPAQRVLRIALDIASGLRAGHEQGLIHRDIKPANVLIARSGIAKIVDLGLAHPFATPDSTSSSTGNPGNFPSSNSPASGTIASRLPVVGTPAYMAPEQSVHPEDVDFRADMYSLGVTMFHAAVGQIPFIARDPARCIELHRTQAVPRPESINAAIPRVLADLIVEMMSKNPAGRPASYDALIDRIVAMLQQLGA